MYFFFLWDIYKLFLWIFLFFMLFFLVLFVFLIFSLIWFHFVSVFNLFLFYQIKALLIQEAEKKVKINFLLFFVDTFESKYSADACPYSRFKSYDQIKIKIFFRIRIFRDTVIVRRKCISDFWFLISGFWSFSGHLRCRKESNENENMKWEMKNEKCKMKKILPNNFI